MSKKKKKKNEVVFNIGLKELRKMAGFTQSDIKEYKQASVSKIESRTDLKISTLMEYLNALNMDLKVLAVKRDEPDQDVTAVTLISTADENKFHNLRRCTNDGCTDE